MTTPREDAIAALRDDVGRFLRRVGGLTVEFRDGKPFLSVRDDWVGDLEAGYRSALGAEAETPREDAIAALRDIIARIDAFEAEARRLGAWKGDAYGELMAVAIRHIARAALAAESDTPERPA